MINTATPLFVTGMTQNTSSITCSKAFVHQLIDGIRLQDLASVIVNSVPTGCGHMYGSARGAKFFNIK